MLRRHEVGEGRVGWMNEQMDRRAPLCWMNAWGAVRGCNDGEEKREKGEE